MRSLTLNIRFWLSKVMLHSTPKTKGYQSRGGGALWLCPPPQGKRPSLCLKRISYNYLKKNLYPCPVGLVNFRKNSLNIRGGGGIIFLKLGILTTPPPLEKCSIYVEVKLEKMFNIFVLSVVIFLFIHVLDLDLIGLNMKSLIFDLFYFLFKFLLFKPLLWTIRPCYSWKEIFTK